MKAELKIEKARSSDHAALVDLLKATNLPPDGTEQHMDSFLVIRHPQAAAKSELLIGSVGLEIYGRSALLRSLAVHPNFQGTGLGTRLVNRVIELAKKKGITRIYLLTDTAEDFFKKKGFTVVMRNQIPEDVKQSIEFTTLCTSSPSMMLDI